jgi:hypothetical protein
LLNLEEPLATISTTFRAGGIERPSQVLDFTLFTPSRRWIAHLLLRQVRASVIAALADSIKMSFVLSCKSRWPKEPQLKSKDHRLFRRSGTDALTDPSHLCVARSVGCQSFACKDRWFPAICTEPGAQRNITGGIRAIAPDPSINVRPGGHAPKARSTLIVMDLPAPIRYTSW